MNLEPFRSPTWHDATPRFGRRLARALVIDVLVFAVLFVAAELGLRAFSPATRKLIVTEELTGGHPRVLNSRQLREREFPIEPVPGERRILCIGNSTTWGSYVALEDTYAKKLESLLGGGTFVVNGGGEGNSPAKILGFLDREGLRYGADVVVLGFSPSMIASTAPAAGSAASSATSPTSVRGLALRLHNALTASYAYAFWDRQVRRGMYRAGVLKDKLDKGGAIYAYAFAAPGVDLPAVEAAYAELTLRLGEIKDLLDRHHIRLVILGIPSRFEISDRRDDNERGFDVAKIRIRPLERVAAAAAAIGVPYVDLLAPLRAERQAMVDGTRPWDDLFAGDYTHLDERGHELAAETLKADLVARGWAR